MIKSIRLTPIILATLLTPALSQADNYLPAFAGKKMEYVDLSYTGQHSSASIEREADGWYLYNGFPGLGKVWLRPEQDGKLYVWDEENQKAKLYVDFSQEVGSTNSYSGSLCAAGTVIKQHHKKMSTAAGTFTDVTEISFFSGPHRCYDAGLGSIYFAKNAGIIKWTDITIMGPRSFELVNTPM
ncbi:hypothetical protein [Zooshikella harenae]|uniref:Uncharacterized protein n=1 Tax=Zooshikella harenae TaxID=2827238 RepID=A0ABS5ZIZ7_9GAMM|nr:hypothetical protein [Zooshikella harenae]MBU2713863.1 hypothetical protein [Zooshikella harenae]